MLQAMSDNQLVARLSEFRLFPERLRVHFAEQLMAYCLSGHDPAVLYDETLKSVLTAAEWEALLLRVRSELLDDLHGAIHTCTADADLSTTDLESVVEPLSTLALHLPDLFPGDDYVAQRAQELDSLLDQWMSDNQSEARPERHDRRPRGSAQADRDWSHGPTRSVFDDLLDGREDVS
jgi:hypothetical protein